jgi:putative inorganic carbon (hco3(-)) transporter
MVVCILSVMSLSRFARQTTIVLFHALLVMVPLVFTWVNEELFEFPKMVLVYGFTVSIVALWLIRMVAEKRWLTRKTVFDWPLLAFVASQILATIFSIHPRTSIFGYYTRFHGGLLSTISYVLLYYAFVNTISKKHLKGLFITLLSSALVVSLYAIPEHFGHSFSCSLISNSFDVDCWVQDVRTRIFGTFGQPNWLAAYVVTVLPLAVVLGAHQRRKTRMVSIVTAICLFLVLLFTRSRSGFAAFGIGMATLALGHLWIQLQNHGLSPKTWWKHGTGVFVGMGILMMVVIAALGSPFTPSVQTFFAQSSPTTEATSPAATPQAAAINRLDEGGTDSGEIRKIVWEGAIRVWQRYPLFGSGVETFAYSYYQDRPVAHNIVSEWDFLYNKAHNEFLNFLATTGVVGLATYVVLLGWFGVVAVRLSVLPTTKTSLTTTDKHITMALLSGVVALSISNFFGFSTVMVSVLWFIFMAILAIFHDDGEEKTMLNRPLGFGQYLGLGTVVLGWIILVGQINTMLAADRQYVSAKSYFEGGYALQAAQLLQKTTEMIPSEALYHDELSSEYARLAVAYHDQQQATQAAKLASAAIGESNVTLSLNPRHLNFHKTRIRIFLLLAQIDSSALPDALDAINTALALAPTDAKLMYNKAIVLNALQKPDEALATYEKTLEMKPNYEAVRMELGKLYEQQGKSADALAQYQYVIERIAPNNELAQQKIEELSQK